MMVTGTAGVAGLSCVSPSRNEEWAANWAGSKTRRKVQNRLNQRESRTYLVGIDAKGTSQHVFGMEQESEKQLPENK